MSVPPPLLQRLIERCEGWTGIDLARGRAHAALERYLQDRMSRTDPEALARYVDGLVTPHHPEAVRLVDAITVCHSSFYRDPEQLAAVTAALGAEPGRPASIWVPGCATGEDAYSMALVAEAAGRRATILATDINTRALAHAARGVYGAWSVRDPYARLVLDRRADGMYEVPERLRLGVTFARHNLMDPAPGGAGGWDLILCRNVLMYLDRARAEEVLSRLAASLRPGGYLFVGASDILHRPPPLLRFVTIEQRQVLRRPPEIEPAPLPVAAPPAPIGADEPERGGRMIGADEPERGGRMIDVAAPIDASALSRSLALLEGGDATGALAILDEILDEDPLCVEARLLAGIAHHAVGDARAAADALRGALLLAPELWPAEMYRGFALAKLGDDDGAARALRRASALATAAGPPALSRAVAAWLEPWRVDAMALGA